MHANHPGFSDHEEIEGFGTLRALPKGIAWRPPQRRESGARLDRQLHARATHQLHQRPEAPAVHLTARVDTCTVSLHGGDDAGRHGCDKTGIRLAFDLVEIRDEIRGAYHGPY